MSTLAQRRILGGFQARTARERMLDIAKTAASRRELTSTRARVIYIVEQLRHIDPAMAEALAQLLPDATDSLLPALRPGALPALLRDQAA